MTTRRITIDRLRIKLPRDMRHDAHSIASSVGNDVARNLAEVASGWSGRLDVGEVSVGHVRDISAAGKKAAISVGEILGSRGRK